MSTIRTFAFAALATTLAACAQTPPAEPDPHHPAEGAAPAPAAPAERMAQMDAHMKAMGEMHERMARARTPEERQALMAEHMKLMQEGMAMMGGMTGMSGMPGMGGMRGRGGMRGMGAMPGGASPMADMAMRQQMLEKRMDMMHSMMQMMMDRMPPSPAGK